MPKIVERNATRFILTALSLALAALVAFGGVAVRYGTVKADVCTLKEEAEKQERYREKIYAELVKVGKNQARIMERLGIEE